MENDRIIDDLIFPSSLFRGMRARKQGQGRKIGTVATVSLPGGKFGGCKPECRNFLRKSLLLVDYMPNRAAARFTMSMRVAINSRMETRLSCKTSAGAVRGSPLLKGGSGAYCM